MEWQAKGDLMSPFLNFVETWDDETYFLKMYVRPLCLESGIMDQLHCYLHYNHKNYAPVLALNIPIYRAE